MRFVGRLILSAVVLFLTVAVGAAACYLPIVFFSFYTGFSRDAAEFLAGISNPFPFALWQVLLVLLVLLLLYGLVRSFVKKRGLLSWLAGVVLTASVLVFLFVGLWGANHFAPSIAQRTGLTVTEYSKDQLLSATRYMAEQASQWADRVDRGETGDMAVNFSRLAAAAGDGFDRLEEENDFFDLDDPTVKPLLAAEAFSYLGVTGIYIPFTGESCVNPNAYNASIPFTMCHELAHSLTVAPEDEANFCAFLACLNNHDPAFQYSGWYTAFVHTYNALQKADPAAAEQVWNSLSQSLRRDCEQATQHYDQYEGQVQDAAKKFNDAYLKAFQEESGIQSYGQVTDLLIAWYLTQV